MVTLTVINEQFGPGGSTYLCQDVEDIDRDGTILNTVINSYFGKYAVFKLI